MVHHLSLHDGIGQDRRRRNKGQLRLTAAVVDDHDLDEPAANVQTYGRSPPSKPEKCHMFPQRKEISGGAGLLQY